MYEEAANAVFRVEEGCCYTQVVFKGAEIGIYPKNDKQDEMTGILICGICDPKRYLFEVSGEFYHACHSLVMQMQKASA
jgi:hypothetical protein